MRVTQALLPGATFDVDRLLTPDEALRTFFSAVRISPPGVETVGLASAYGRICAADVAAPEALPANDRSTMDGFAVRSADGLTMRRIVGAVRMGHPPGGPIGRGEAMAIPTGGTLPPGADAVVPIEDASAEGEALAVHTSPEAQAYVTSAGSDLAAGELALPAGRLIGGPELGVLAALGRVEPVVFRRPRVAVVSTGDELVDAAIVPGIGQIRDSNRWAIAGALAALGADVVAHRYARDTLADLRACIAQSLSIADAVILTGGSSVGERDLTPDAIETFEGPGVVVHGLRVKPGKPTVLAAVGSKPIVGLPGNPTSALMILEAVCAPIVRALTGHVGFRPVTIRAIAAEAFRGRPGWTWFMPAELRVHEGGERAYPLALRSAHASLLARATGYVTLTPERPSIEAGEELVITRSSGGR